MATAAARGARAHLELGGKAPCLVFDVIADLDATRRRYRDGRDVQPGQDCTAATRVAAHVKTDALVIE